MRTAVAFFLLAALFGTTMRLMFVVEVPFLHYKHVMHAHSHVAMLGWVYAALSGGLLLLFRPDEAATSAFRALFVINVIATLGMATAFLLSDYSPVSIAFSSLHFVSAVLFARRLFPALRASGNSERPPPAEAVLARAALVWMLVSMVGLLAVAPVAQAFGRLHPLYFASIQFFLHFQFNGWFTCGALALFARYLALRGSPVRLGARSMPLLHASIVFTYALSITWSTPASALFYANSLGVALQLAAFARLGHAFLSAYAPVRRVDWTHRLLESGAACIALKAVIQLAVALPFVAVISYTIRGYVIGFIHLVVIGSVTLTVAGVFLQLGLFPANRASKVGWHLLLAAFGLTEALLLGQGTLLWLRAGFIPGYHEALLAATLLFPAGLLSILPGFAGPVGRRTLMAVRF